MPDTKTRFTNEQILRKTSRRRTITHVVIYVLLAVWGIMVLFPFYWMLLTSIKGYGAYSSEYIPKFFTLSPTLENYAEAFTAVPLAKYFLNTLIFTVFTTLLMMIVIILAAFAFARLEFRGKNVVFALFVKLLVLTLSVFGLTTMWIAVFADVGVALLCVLNALRTMKIK